jgi:hypothetical protein
VRSEAISGAVRPGTALPSTRCPGRSGMLNIAICRNAKPSRAAFARFRPCAPALVAGHSPGSGEIEDESYCFGYWASGAFIPSLTCSVSATPSILKINNEPKRGLREQNGVDIC